MTIEDNTFDFKVRDRLLKECKNADYDLHYNPNDNKVMMDMITYCSQGNEEEAVLNLKTTKEFLRRFASIRNTFGFHGYLTRYRATLGSASKCKLSTALSFMNFQILGS